MTKITFLAIFPRFGSGKPVKSKREAWLRCDRDDGLSFDAESLALAPDGVHMTDYMIFLINVIWVMCHLRYAGSGSADAAVLPESITSAWMARRRSCEPNGSGSASRVNPEEAQDPRTGMASRPRHARVIRIRFRPGLPKPAHKGQGGWSDPFRRGGPAIQSSQTARLWLGHPANVRQKGLDGKLSATDSCTEEDSAYQDHHHVKHGQNQAAPAR